MPGWTDRLRAYLGQNRELEARLAYMLQRRHDLASHADDLDPEDLATFDEALAEIRDDLRAHRAQRAANGLNDLDERLATLEHEAEEAQEERSAHARRVERLRRSLAGSRSRLVGLRLGGIGADGLAMLEARLERAERSTTPAAIAAAEAEAQAIERALDRLAERVMRDISKN
jgi:FtsZ-binding cell division protein ZapB